MRAVESLSRLSRFSRVLSVKPSQIGTASRVPRCFPGVPEQSMNRFLFPLTKGTAMPKFIHVPTEAELEKLIRRHQAAVARWEHARKVAGAPMPLPEEPQRPANWRERMRIVRWFTADAVIRHRKAAVYWTARRVTRAGYIRSLFLRNELN